MNNLKRISIHLFAIMVFAGLSASTMQAQRSAGDVGIGIQVGQPTGLTVKVYNPGTSLDFLAAWDLNDFYFLNIHAMWDTALNDAHTIHLFYGPGGYIGVREREEASIADYGISGNFGIDLLINKFELFLQATPRLSLLSTRDFEMGGGVGFRIYL